MNTDRKQLAKQQARELLLEQNRERAKIAARERARAERQKALRDLAKREASK